jgi:lysosomal acid lipase/cholesteryl ester hydrolase
MVNPRGSKYSMRHRLLNPTSFQFWMFSFHEIGMYDYSASIDYILRTTSKVGVYFVGHNQACTALLVLLSMRPQYNPKIIQAHLMGPIAWMDNIHPMIAFNIDRRMQSTYLTRTFNFYSLAELMNVTISTYCNPNDPSALMYCMNLWFFMFGRNRNGTEMDPNILLSIPNHISPTASSRQWNHFLQIYKKGRFQTYDGTEDSYYEGFSTEYNLQNVKVPIVLYHAAEDMITSKLVLFNIYYLK